MKLQKTLAAAGAITLIGGCTATERHTNVSEAPPASTPSLVLGPNSTQSGLRYNGTDAPYLLAIDCIHFPKTTYTTSIPQLALHQTMGEPWTVGDTTESVPHVNTLRNETASFIAGITLRQRDDGSVEFVDSLDSGLASGYTTTEVGPGLVAYVIVPNSDYALAIGIDGAKPGMSGAVSISCEQTDTHNIPAQHASTTPSAII